MGHVKMMKLCSLITKERSKYLCHDTVSSLFNLYSMRQLTKLDGCNLGQVNANKLFTRN